MPFLCPPGVPLAVFGSVMEVVTRGVEGFEVASDSPVLCVCSASDPEYQSARTILNTVFSASDGVFEEEGSLYVDMSEYTGW